MSENILSMKDIRKSFFGVEVLHGISLDIKKGSVHGLVGENGAGKSTLMNVLGGVLQPDQGTMLVDGKPYLPSSPKDAQDACIAFVHQELNLFSNLTVAENLFIENIPTGFLKRVKYKKMTSETAGFMDSFGIRVNPKTKVESLSMGVRQSIEIAKALVINANVIIFDEPTTSLTKLEKENLFRIIRDLQAQGVSIIYISHILEDVLDLCDEISVLRDGSLVSTLQASDTNRDELISLMVGRKLDSVFPTVEKEIGEELLRCTHIHSDPLVKDASLVLHKGEILGIFGLMGAGRTELVRALFGLNKIQRGTVIYRGKDITGSSPRQAIREGIALVTEDRRNEGLLMPRTVVDNLTLVHLPSLTGKLGVVDAKRGAELADDSIQALHIRVQDKSTQLVQNLSGGNQQKVVIGKWLFDNPALLILDEPTRGVDVGAKYEIYTIIQSIAQRQSGILIVSSEMEELIGICDRIVVMSNGHTVGEVNSGEFSQDRIIAMALPGGKKA